MTHAANSSCYVTWHDMILVRRLVQWVYLKNRVLPVKIVDRWPEIPRILEPSAWHPLWFEVGCQTSFCNFSFQHHRPWRKKSFHGNQTKKKLAWSPSCLSQVQVYRKRSEINSLLYTTPMKSMQQARRNRHGQQAFDQTNNKCKRGVHAFHFAKQLRNIIQSYSDTVRYRYMFHISYESYVICDQYHIVTSEILVPSSFLPLSMTQPCRFRTCGNTLR